MYKTQNFTPSAKKTEFNCSKPFLYKGIDGSNPVSQESQDSQHPCPAWTFSINFIGTGYPQLDVLDVVPEVFL